MVTDCHHIRCKMSVVKLTIRSHVRNVSFCKLDLPTSPFLVIFKLNLLFNELGVSLMYTEVRAKNILLSTEVQ